MKNKKIGYILLGGTFLSAFLSFYSIYRAIKIPNTSVWAAPMIWLSICLSLLLLANILVKRILEVEIVVGFSMLLSGFFAANLWHFVILFISIFIFLAALRNMRSDLDLNVKISLWKSLYTGKFKMTLALAMIIASQYYFTIVSINGPIKIPKFDVSQISTEIAKPILIAINPEYKALANKNSKLANDAVAPVGEVINKYFSSNISGNDRSSTFPIILASVLFFTIWPIGSIMSVFWIWIVIFVFKMLVKKGIVKIEKVKVERERIA